MITVIPIQRVSGASAEKTAESTNPDSAVLPLQKDSIWTRASSVNKMNRVSVKTYDDTLMIG